MQYVFENTNMAASIQFTYYIVNISEIQIDSTTVCVCVYIQNAK